MCRENTFVYKIYSKNKLLIYLDLRGRKCMSNIGEMVSILKKYYNNISTGFSFYIKGEMPSNKSICSRY